MKHSFSKAQSLAYLFAVDLVRQQHHSYSSYEEKEKGYAKAWFEAYVEAFDYSNDGMVTHDLLKLIHSTAMAWSGTKDHGYKQSHNNILMHFSSMLHSGRKSYNPSYSVSFEGVKEFLTYWFINQEVTTHLMGFVDWNQTKPNVYGVRNYDKDSATFQFTTNIQGMVRTQNLSLEQVLQTLKSLIDAGKITNVTVDGFETLTEAEIPATTESFAQKIMDEYHQAMEIAHSKDAKITAIAELVQRLDQLHPFMDGNIRTCYILMNKLLRDNQLGLSLVVNPNRFDGCSVAEVKHMIGDGQALFQSILASFSDGHNSHLELTSAVYKQSLNPIQCTPQQMAGVSDRLLSQFFEVLGVSLSKPQPAIGFFEESILQALPTYLIEPMEKAQYSLAFRRACAKADTTDIILKVIAQAQGDININETSSNGKSAIDWLAHNSQLTLKDKRLINDEIHTLALGAVYISHR